MKSKNILFRADSSSKIGLGHIMRDLVLAKQFKNANSIFACLELDGNIINKIPYEVIRLFTMEIDELIGVIKKRKIDMLVIDHYGIDEKDEKKIKEFTNIEILVLDDTYEKHYCDVLLNHNIYADESRYEGLVPSFCELKCGSKYTLIRDEFIQEKRKKIVFLAMGGTDPSNINLKILRILNNFDNIKVYLVTTSVNKNLEKLKKYIKKNSFIKIHIDSKKLAKLMKRSDLAIVSPSVIMHEVLYMNLPFIAIKTADNQDEIYRYIKKKGFFCLKDFRKDNRKKFQKEIRCHLIVHGKS